MPTHDRVRLEGLFAINLATVIFGTVGLFGTIDVSPFWIVAVRGGSACLALLALALLRDRIQMPQRLGPFILTGAILAVHWLTFFTSVKLAGVAIATVTVVTYPLFTILIEAARSRRWPPVLHVIAAMVMIAAVTLLSGGAGTGKHQLAGVAVGLVSAALFSVFSLISADLGNSVSGIMMSVGQNAVVFLLVAPFLVLPLANPAPDTARQWLLLIVLGVVTTATTHQLFFYALRRISAVACGGFLSLEPLYAVVFASWLQGERVGFVVVFCALLMIGASLLLAREPSR